MIDLKSLIQKKNSVWLCEYKDEYRNLNELIATAIRKDLIKRANHCYFAIVGK